MNYELKSNELKGIDDKLVAGVEPATYKNDEAMKKIEEYKQQAEKCQSQNIWNRILENLSLDDIYGDLLTGKQTDDGWLECRDPFATGDSAKTMARVADGTGEFEKGTFHSFSTKTTISIVEFLIRMDKATDTQDARELLADIANVRMPKTEEPDDENRIIDELNQEYAVLQIGNMVRILREHQWGGKTFISYLKKSDFDLLLSNRKFVLNDGKKNKEESWSKIWLQHKDRRQYSGVEFEPNGGNPQFYNLWRGLAVTPKQGNCDLYLEHLRENICCGNEEHYNYVIAWIAHAVQKPEERPETAIVLRGKQGTGKGVFVNKFGELFGEHYLQISQSRHLVGNFNSHLQNRIVLFADEAFWAGDKKSEGVLKALITEPYLAIEQKNVDVIRIANRIRLIMASNENWVVPASVDDRRFMVLNVSDQHQKDIAYFKKINDQMKNGGQEALLHFLMNYDLSNVDLRQIPQTEALLEQKMQSLDPIYQFWYECLQDSYIGMATNDWMQEVAVDSVYCEYREFVKNLGGTRSKSKSVFGQELRKVCPQVDTTRTKANGIRINKYIFPSLHECRRAFENYVGMEIKWIPINQPYNDILDHELDCKEDGVHICSDFGDQNFSDAEQKDDESNSWDDLY